MTNRRSYSPPSPPARLRRRRLLNPRREQRPPRRGKSTWHNAGKRGIAWHHLSTNFGDNKFFRSGWETVVFKDVNNTTRKGFYLQPRGKSYYITFNGWDDIKLEAVRKQ
ncbi:uncharacterized protein SCHCODRAFT_02677561 [Schizophyllum commune H4-8]|uniref:uncharacterized protein n=1 Tax=Schizophyllum commune (strain H4-8 / FGSC 9210) TaxID=578458 RepID=UPI00215F7207|nr:uncharacterized protein SCHCODRAFT_02677561 [Schizophyllum commune H4-8]KAI5893496.1 hypothetical protein SCHCODRAFT_02677561 [Schizophyllum commune H4-8]